MIRAANHSQRLLFALTTLMLVGILLIPMGCHNKPASADSAPAADDAGAKDDGKAGGDDAAVPSVTVVKAQYGTLDQTLPVTGTLAALRDREAMIAPPIAGLIDSLPVHFGQHVDQGQVIAHLSTRTMLGQLQQAEAAIAQNGVQVQQAQASAVQQEAQSRAAILQAQSAVSVAKAALASAEATLTGDEASVVNAAQSLARQNSLFSDGLVAQKDVEAAQLALRTAEAQRDAQRHTIASQRETVAGQEQAVDAARAAALQDVVKRQDIQVARQQLANSHGALTTAQSQLSLYTIRAPISGIVTNVTTGIGETVDPSTKIVTIADLSRLQLQIAIPSAAAGSVRVGQSVRFTVDSVPGHVFAGTIQTIGNQVDPASSTITAIANIDNRSGQLKDDLYAHVQIVLSQKPHALVVPRSALLLTPGADSSGSAAANVVVVGTDNVAHVTPVTTGLSNTDEVEITSGLHPGDQVGTIGVYALPDGTKVKVDDAGSKSDGDASK